MEDPISLHNVNTIGDCRTFKLEGYNLKLLLMFDGRSQLSYGRKDLIFS